jgi:hypothetical protein
MASETAPKSDSQGMSQPARDRFEVASKSIAIIGGIISALGLIITLQGSITQRSTEHRWNQAKLAMELIDDMLSDPQAFDALRMIDWDSRTYQVGKDHEEKIGTGEVHDALDVRNNSNLSPAGVYVRESFDRLFYHLGKLERAIDSDLVRFEDVDSPLDYYVPIFRSKYGDAAPQYMKQLGDRDAMGLLERFPRDSGSRTVGSGASAGRTHP